MLAENGRRDRAQREPGIQGGIVTDLTNLGGRTETFSRGCFMFERAFDSLLGGG